MINANSVTRREHECILLALLVVGLALLLSMSVASYALAEESAIEIGDAIELKEDEPSEQTDSMVEDVLVQNDSQDKSDISVDVQSATLSVSGPHVRYDQVTTWECLLFGSYPQSEVTSADAVYGSLQRASWDANGDATVDGAKYRRISKYDVTSSDYWPDGSPTWRYFCYEPIKWRVLNVSGSTALVVADVGLDDQQYNPSMFMTWENSSIRSWLNGYGALSNQPRIDYSNKNFISTAFSSSERSAIIQTHVINATYDGTGGNDADDKVFLLSYSEALNDSYGFITSNKGEGYRCKPSDYANAMGAWKSDSEGYEGNCDWWLRTLGNDGRYARYVSYDGATYSNRYVNDPFTGVRPALNLDLRCPDLQAAGTVSSNGDVSELPYVPDPVQITSVILKTAAFTYNGKAKRPSVTVKAGDVVVPATDYSVSYANNVKAGTATVTVVGKGDYAGRKTVRFTIAKATNPMRLKAVKRTVKASKTKAQSCVVARPIGFVKKARGNVSYARVAKGSSKWLAVNKKTGKVTVKKGAKKGTYKVRIKVTAAGTANYKKVTKTLTCTVVVQ